MATIDVVIPTFARPAGLRRCLAALTRQTFRDFSVTVVDDASPIAAELAFPSEYFRELDLRVLVNATNLGPAGSRNAGVAVGRAPAICFLDDDVEPEPELLERHLRRLAAGSERTVVVGPMLPPAATRLPGWLTWEAEKLGDQYAAMERGDWAPSWRQFYTGNVSLSRAAFRAAGGFDERLRRAEDIELAIRLDKAGCTFAFEPRAAVRHHSEHTLEAWLRIPRHYARTDVIIDRMHPDRGLLDLVEREGGVRARRLRRLVAVPGAARAAPAAALAVRHYGAAFQLSYWAERRAIAKKAGAPRTGSAIPVRPLARA